MPKLDEELHGKRPGDILKFDDELPERFGERAGEEVVVPGAREGRQEEGAARAHRRVGDRGERVRDRRRAARRRPHSASTCTPACRRRWRCARRSSRRPPTSCPTTCPTRSSNSEMERRLHDLAHRLEEQGIKHDDPAVPRRHRSGPAGVRRQRARRRDEAVRADLALRAVITQEEIAATDDEVDAEIDRLAEQHRREARQGPQGSRTAGGHRGGTLGHRTRQGARVPHRPRGRGRRRRQTRRPLPSAARAQAEGSGTGATVPTPTKPPKHRTAPAQEAPEEEPVP